MKRYERNQKSINNIEQEKLAKAKVCIVGCGGLGGYNIEMLARIGIGFLTVVDGDSFVPSNLNRQILCTEQNLGCKKAAEAKKRIELINSSIKVNAVEEMLDKNNAESILSGHDIIVDALDSISTRLLVQETCEKLGIPMIYGAIAGWFGQVATIFPGEKTLDKIYKDIDTVGCENKLGNLSFSPTMVASLQVSETIKVLLAKGKPLKGKMLFIDLLENEFRTLF